MKNTISYLSIAALWAFALVFFPHNITAQAANPVDKAEQELNKAIDNLQAEINRIREAIKQNPKYHETFAELKKKREALKKAADKLLDETKKQREQAQRKIDRERNQEKKRQAQSDKAEGDKIRDAIDDWAKKAKDLADAHDNEKGDYDKAREALDAAKKALDEARATKAVRDAEEALEEERNKTRPNANKIAKLEDALKKAKEDLEKLQKQEGVRSAQPETPDDQGQSSRSYYFVGSVTGSLPFGDLDPQSLGLPELQAALFSPGTMPELMELLQGEYFPGTLTGETALNYTMAGRASFSPGLRIGMGFGKRLELRAQGQYFQQEWQGSFPLSIFPFESSAPYTIQGNLNSSTQGFIAESDLAFFLSTGTVRPYLKAGGRGFFTTENNRWASVGGLDMPLDAPTTSNTYSVFGGGGVRIGVLKNGFVELGATYGKVPGAGYLPAIDCSAGWRFVGNKAPKPRPMNVNANLNPPKKQCKCESLTAKLLIQNLTRLEKIQAEIEEKKALLADIHLDETQKKEAQTALSELEKMLSDKVYEEERSMTQDGALPASIVSRIAEAGDRVKLKIKALDIGSKICHCTNPENDEPDCIFSLIAIAEDGAGGLADRKFSRVEEGGLKYTTVWFRAFEISNTDQTIKFSITGKCEKPGDTCNPSDPAGRTFEINFRKADVHDNDK